MGFFQRIARGWHLMFYSFVTIYKEQPYLLTAALLICAVPVVLYFIGALALGQFTTLTQWLGLSIPDLSQLRVPEHINWYMILVGIIIGLIVTYAYILYIALLYFFKAFLQDQHISFKAAVKVVLPRIPLILMWVILEMVGHRLIFWAVPVSPIIYTVMYTIWIWLTLFVVPVLAFEKTRIFTALRVSVTVALEAFGDIVGANLWLLSAVLVPGILAIALGAWVANQISLLTVTSGGFSLALLGLYLAGVFAIMLAFANIFFVVALYLLATGQPVSHIPARIRALYSEPEQPVPDQL